MHTNELNFTFWNAGIYLNTADFRFAPENLRKEWDEASQRSALGEAKEKMEELKNSDTDFLSAWNEIAATIGNANRPKEILKKRMRDLVVNWLLRGELVAFAFEKPRRMDSLPYQLPAQLWRGQIDWFNSSLSAQGLDLVEVRLLSKHMIETVAASNVQETPPLEAPRQPAKGRPTIQPQIAAAYHQVAASEVLDEAMSLKTVSGHVRIQLAKNCPELNVTEDTPSYETIRRVISPLRKEDTKQ